jgi:hypothetical protein
MTLARPRRKRLVSYILVGLMAGGCLLQAACGGSMSKNVPSVPNAVAGTPAGTYTVQVIGTAGSTQHSTTLALVVQ